MGRCGGVAGHTRTLAIRVKLALKSLLVRCYNAWVNTHQTVRCAMAIAACLLALAPTTRADELEAKYLDGLRARRLFTLAEKYCNDLLASQKLKSEHRALIAMELSRTLVEHGKYKSAAQRRGYWNRAQSVLFDAAGAIPEPGLKLKLTAQEAINQGHQATYLRWQAQVAPQDGFLRETSLIEIDKAQQSIAAAQKQANRPQPDSPFERDRLRNALSLANVQMTMNRARMEKPGSVLRLELAKQAEATAKRLSTTAVENHIRVEAMILYAECTRERGDGTKAETLLDKAIEKATSDSDRDRIVAERIHGLLYEKRPDEATSLLIKYRRMRGSLSGELHVLRMRSLIELWRVASNAKNAKTADNLLAQLESGAKYARQEVGGYWAFRCDRLLESARAMGKLGPGLAGLKQQAEREYSAGNMEAATELFTRAAQMAERERRDDAAVDLSFKLGSVLVQRKLYDPAADAFYKSATLVQPSNENGHLMYAWCLGQLYREQATKERREAYTLALDEHRRVFPGSETYNEATYLRAALEERRLQNTKAIELYRAIKPGHKRYVEANAAIARCYSKILGRLHQLKHVKLRDWQERSSAELASRIRTLPTQGQALSPAAAEFAIYAGSVLLQGLSPDYPAASKLIQRGVSAVQTQEPTPRSEQLLLVADRWKLITAVATGDQATAVAWVDQQKSRSTDALLGVLTSLDEQVKTTDARLIRLLSNVKLQVAEQLLTRESELSEPDRNELASRLVELYVVANRQADALRQAKQIAKSAKDVSQLESVANLIQSISGTESQTLSRSMWKQVESKTKAGSERWLTARLHIAQCTLALGQKSECKKLLQVTRLLYPELGSASLKSAFEQLERDLSR